MFETLLIRFSLVFWFVVFCVRFWTPPWRFFQLNAEYFNENKGLFSKLETDQYIPKQWRLEQHYEDTRAIPFHFPVFIKPEWGQNARGIYRADTLKQFRSIQKRINGIKIPHMIQEAAVEAREFEIFYICAPEHLGNFSFLSITETVNSQNDRLPINGIHNKNTTYIDRTNAFSDLEIRALWQHISTVGDFPIARVCIRANSEKGLLAGSFHIVEINLFLPMPLSLLDPHLSWHRKQRFIKKAMSCAARAVQAIPKEQQKKLIFWKQVIAHYRVSS